MTILPKDPLLILNEPVGQREADMLIVCSPDETTMLFCVLMSTVVAPLWINNFRFSRISEMSQLSVILLLVDFTVICHSRVSVEASNGAR
jgi:hypothetical protein